MKIEIENITPGTSKKVYIPVKVLERNSFTPISFFWNILNYSYFLIIDIIILFINYFKKWNQK